MTFDEWVKNGIMQRHPEWFGLGLATTIKQEKKKEEIKKSEDEWDAVEVENDEYWK